MFNDVIPLNVNMAGQAPFINVRHPDIDVDTYSDAGLNVYVDHTFDHYKQVLLSSPEIRRWFSKRKINITDDLIERFCLGFADRTLCKAYKREMGRQSEIVRGALQVLGLLKPTGHQYFHGDVVFPLFDAGGHIVGAYGRRVLHENRPNRVYFHHWFNGNATFFNRQALQDFECIIICKNPVEAVTLISAGFLNVISIMGIYSFGHHHLADLEKFRPSEVILAFDNSDTGNHISGLVAQILDAQDIDCFRLPLPKNKDINAFAQDYDEHVPALKALIEGAFPYQQSYENLVRR